MTARLQLNGLVVLYAYLQRIFVYDKVIALIPDEAAAPAAVAELPALLERTGAATTAFDTSAGLHAATVAEFDAVLAAVRAAMSERAAQPHAPLRNRLAAIAGDRYHAEYLINGLVHWGTQFAPEAADYYRQQTPATRDQVAVISGLVDAASKDALSADDLARIDTWHDQVVAFTPAVAADLDLTADLLHGRTPA